MKEIFYDAFISYRHTELDSYIAKKLHGMLEHYRIPKKIQKSSGKKKITRIFRDQEELPLSSDLSSNIKIALEQSEFLIVICSPESMESRWVKTEIETFLKTHSKDRVLTILVRGEPEEAFPQMLCYREQVVIEEGVEKTIQVPVEPLAADVRAACKEESGKKLKKEILRILAPMLSCRYDDLRQRQKEYKMKVAMGILGAVGCMALAFGIYASRQAAAIEEQYQQSRKNQARYLCNISEQRLKSGDRDGALQTALGIQNEDETAVVPEQVYALNTALYSYQQNAPVYLESDQRVQLEGPLTSLYPDYAAEYSPEGTYYFLMDFSGKVYIYDGKTNQQRYAVTADDFEELKGEVFLNGIPLSETEVILLTASKVVKLDAENGKIVSLFHRGNSNEFANFYMQANQMMICENYLLIEDTFSFEIYDLEQEVAVLIKEDGFEDADTWYVQASALSPNGKKAVTFELHENANLEKSYHLYVWDLITGENSSYEFEVFHSLQTCFINDDLLAIAWIPDDTDTYSLEKYRSYCYGTYDINNGNFLWQKEGATLLADYTTPILSVNQMRRMDGETRELTPMIASSVGNQMKITQALSGEELAHVESRSSIVGIEQLDLTRYFVATAEGDLGVCTTSSQGALMVTGACSLGLQGFLYSEKQQRAILISDYGNQILCYRAAQDPYMTKLDNKTGTIIYSNTEENGYRVFIERQIDDLKRDKATIVDVSTGEVLGTVVPEEANKKIQFHHAFCDGAQDFCVYSTASQDYKKEPQRLYLKNMDTNEILYELQLENLPNHTGTYYADRYDDSYQMAVTNHSDVAAIYMENGNYFQLIDYKTGEILLPFREVETLKDFEALSFFEIVPSEDGKYFIMHGKRSVYGTDRKMGEVWFAKLWNIENQQWEAIDGKETFYIQITNPTEISFGSKQVVIGRKRMIAAMCLAGEEVLLIDLKNGQIIQRVPLLSKNGCDMALFDEEQYLLLIGDEDRLSIWGIKEEKYMMKVQEPLRKTTGIYVDESNRYFGVACSESYGDYTFKVFYVDEEQRIYPYANIRNGFANFKYEEMFNFGYEGSCYVTKFYDYATLKQRAEELLDGKTFTDEELRMYYISY